MILVIRWAIFAILACFWLMCVVCNAVSGMRSLVRGNSKHISPVPVVGMLTGFVALAMIPLEHAGPSGAWAMLALLPELLWIWPIPIVIGVRPFQKMKRK